MTEIERYKGAMKIALEVLDVCTRHMENERYTASTIADLARINAILNPQEFEDVPVTRWECKECASTYDKEGKVISKGVNWSNCRCAGDSEMTFELTGTIRRAVPQKVERSVIGEVEWDHQDGLCVPLGASAPLIPFRELIGKRGTLTFTWTE